MSAETQVQTTFDKLYAVLTPEEVAGLSKVLFPDTDTRHVNLLKQRRELTPLVIKWAKKIRAVMQPWAKKLDEAVKSPDGVDVDLDLMEALKAAALVLCEVYGWDDVKTAIVEEEVSSGEIQNLVAVQVKLQGEHDFLVVPLRVAVMVMQSVEIQQMRYRSMFGG